MAFAGFVSRLKGIFQDGRFGRDLVGLLVAGSGSPFIVKIEAKLSIPGFGFPLQAAMASMLFALNSVVGIASALTMAKSGCGTPLPMDSASKLVTTGTYAFVRNPMAISGIGRGLSVGLFLGSPLVLLHALLGAAIWQTIIRPLEEEDLLARFGEEYERYRGNVRCWIPRWR